MEMKRSVNFIAIILSLVAAGSLRADNMTDKLEDEFLVPPVYLSLDADNGKTCEICIAGTRTKKTKIAGIGVTLAGPNKSCPGEPKDYAEANSREKLGIVATAAKFEGDAFHPAELDGEYWLYKSVPIAIYYRTDAKTPSSKEKWSQVVASVIYLDPRKSTDSKLKILAFSPKRTEVEGGFTKVVAGNIGRSMQDKLPTEKPKFIGDLAELAKLAASNKKEDTSSHSSFAADSNR